LGYNGLESGGAPKAREERGGGRKAGRSELVLISGVPAD